MALTINYAPVTEPVESVTVVSVNTGSLLMRHAKADNEVAIWCSMMLMGCFDIDELIEALRLVKGSAR